MNKLTSVTIQIQFDAIDHFNADDVATIWGNILEHIQEEQRRMTQSFTKIQDFDISISNASSSSRTEKPTRGKVLSEEDLILLIVETIDKWVDEEMSANEHSSVSREQRLVEHRQSFLEELEDKI